jgi:alpha-amylase
MISIRKANPVISKGTYKTLPNNSDQVFSFTRHDGKKQVIVAVNLSEKPVNVTITRDDGVGLNVLYGTAKPVADGNSITVQLPAYGVEVLGI